jgi:hypothetical protein
MHSSLSSALIFLPLLAGCAPGSSLDRGDTDEAREDELVAIFGEGNIDVSRTSRILLVGDSHLLGAQPLYAATTRARRYAEIHPDDQIVLFLTKDASAAKVAKAGAQLIDEGELGDVAVSDLVTLEASILVDALDAFERIASVDFFGHSSPFGALLETQGEGNLLSPTSTEDLAELKDNFARELHPYITLNGCNGGAHTAAELSTLLELPVSGALTGTMFQKLMSDGRWYYDDPAFYPSNVTHAPTNLLSFDPYTPSPSCKAGGCTRLKPQDSPYRGVWADPTTGFQYGLNHYKFFCAYDDADSSCVRGMAQALYAWPSIRPIHAGSTAAEVEDVLVDYFCSTNVDISWFDKCAAGLRQAAAQYTGFATMKSASSYVHECDAFGCEQKLRCTMVNGVPQRKTCVWVAKGCQDGQAATSTTCKVKNTTKMTTVDEWHRFLEGHALQ